MTIENLPAKYLPIWKKSLPLLKKGRPGDDRHAKEVVEFILSYQGKLKFDQDVLIPTAMMHDIGHSAILPEHFKYITGPDKVKNGKLVHMLAGAKIANDILTVVGYDKKATDEVVEIISMHDYDQLEGADLAKIYNTANKRLFHDIDSLDRYTEVRLNNTAALYPDRKELMALLENYIDLIFSPEIKSIARERLERLKH